MSLEHENGRVMKYAKLLNSSSTKESDVLKILQKLSGMDITLGILQSTHIGKAVNQLRKRGGVVSTTAKFLIKQWKQLLPSAGHAGSSNHNTSLQHVRSPHHAKTTQGTSSSTSSHHDYSLHSSSDCSSTRNIDREQEQRGRSREGGRGTSSNPNSSHTHKSSIQQRAHMSSDRNTAGSVQTNRKHTQGVTGSCQHGASSTVSSGSSRSGVGSSAEGYTGLDNLLTPGRGGTLVTGGGSPRKRKGALLDAGEDRQVVAALSKRSRTQVYSGKSSGLKSVPSLFSMCMGVLIDNIDVIQEVGGIPYFILEPMLQRCTPTQLMRLEEYNPHFIEDGDVLWQKHCQKEFKVVQPSPGETWRELYIERLAEREKKMRSITDTIREKQRKREEPVRKAILAAPPITLPRSRHRAFSATYNNTTGRGTPNSSLMKQTMKMAKQRQMMTKLMKK